MRIMARVSLLTLMFVMASPPPATLADSTTFPEVQNRCRRITDDVVIPLCRQLDGLIPTAAAQAEAVSGFPVDTGLLRISLKDRSTKASKMTGRVIRMHLMQRRGFALDILVEPILRGDYERRPDLSASLSHEFIHLGIRQHMAQDSYSALPEWFKEGTPTYLMDQGRDKLSAILTGPCDAPQRLVEACLDGGEEYPYVTGAHFFAALAEVTADGDVLPWVHAVIASGSIDDASVEFNLDLTGIWQRAGDLLMADIEALIGDSTADNCSCREYSSTKQDGAQAALECWALLAKNHPTPLNQAMATYWQAKAHYHLKEYARAVRGFTNFLDAEVSSGLVDDAHFYRLKACYLDGSYEEAKALCNHALMYYPESRHRKETLEAYWRLVALKGQ